MICKVPSPRDVVTPATVAKTANTSITFPIGPLTPFSPIRGSNKKLIKPGLFFLNWKYAKARPNTA